MKSYILAACLISSAPALSAIHCGGFTIQPDRYRTTINGDVVHIIDAQFYGAPRDYGRATIKLLPDAITTTDRQYRMMAEGSNATLELMTRENPPRVLYRAQCDTGLTGFEWYTSAP
ncbi:TPA: hypothetical protein R2W59_003582 [Escherichia coli]|nr:hypothetical protein [Escherichia coli]